MYVYIYICIHACDIILDNAACQKIPYIFTYMHLLSLSSYICIQVFVGALSRLKQKQKMFKGLKAEGNAGMDPLTKFGHKLGPESRILAMKTQFMHAISTRMP